MATAELAAKRYAHAAFEIAVEKGDVGDWTTGIERMAAFMSDPEVRRVLENTRVSRERKQELVQAGLGDLPPLLLNLARLLVRKGRTSLAPDLAEEFTRLAEEQHGITRARAVTAVALNDGERDALRRRLRERTGGEVLLETEVDPDVLGGVIVQIGDRLIDASMRARLEALRNNLVGAV